MRSSAVEGAAYDKRVDVYFQRNDWVNSQFRMYWPMIPFSRSPLGAGGNVQREIGWLFSPATRTGRGQTNFGNIARGWAKPFIGFSLPAAPTRFSPSTLAKAAGSRSLSASSSTCGFTTEKTSLSGIPTSCRHPSVVCCSPDQWQMQSRPSKRGRNIGSVFTKYRVRQ